jgi:hypothetical protein
VNPDATPAASSKRVNANYRERGSVYGASLATIRGGCNTARFSRANRRLGGAGTGIGAIDASSPNGGGVLPHDDAAADPQCRGIVIANSARMPVRSVIATPMMCRLPDSDF